jgi:DNA-binding SARP family transcriptional activator/Tfp pilus assembly protein PilF
MGLSKDGSPLLAGRRKVLAVLAYVAREENPVPRARLATLFWSDRDEQHAKHSVRQAIAELRGALGAVFETLEDGSVAVAKGALFYDAAQLEQAVKSADWRGAAALWHGEFLPASENLGGLEWIHWLEAQRAALRDQAARTFAQLATAALEAGDASAAAEWAAQWCKIAPLDEAANACRIEALLALRRMVDAASCYEMFVRHLSASGLTGPSPAFLALRDRLFAAGRPATAPRSREWQRLTLSSLAHLSSDARSLLEAAAALAEPAPAALLGQLAELPLPAASLLLGELVGRGALVEDERKGCYVFASEEARRLVYTVIAPDRRGALHRAIALALERQGAGREHVERHRRLAGMGRRTVVRRGAVAGIVAAALALLGGGNFAWRLLLAHDGEAPQAMLLTVEPGRVAVEDQSGDAILAATLVGLRQSPRLRVQARTRAGWGELSGPAHAAQLGGQRDDAALASSGRLLVDVGRSGALYSVGVRLMGPNGRLLASDRVVGEESQIVDKLDTLLRRVRSSLGESAASLDASTRPLRFVASASLQALAAYVNGVRAFDAGDRRAARQAWTLALSLDSAFALAALELTGDALDESDFAAADRWLALALRSSERLAPPELARARFLAALRRGDTDSALLYAQRAQSFGPSLELWNRLGWFALEQRRCDLALPAFSQLLTADSPNPLPHAGLAQCALEAGDLLGAVRTFARAESLGPGQLIRGGALRRWVSLLVRKQQYAEAERALQHFLERAASAGDSASLFQDLSALYFFRGRYASGMEVLELAAATLERSGDSAGLFATRVAQAAGHMALGARAQSSERIDQALALGASYAPEPQELFQLGHLMARIGRVNGAREVLRLVEARARPARAQDQWAELLLRASLALAERLPEEALAALESAADRVPAPGFMEGYRLALSADAKLLAGRIEQARLEAQRLEEAWLLFTPAQEEWLRATLRVGRLAELAGDEALALAAYRRALERWKEADRELVDLAQAQRAVARLGNAVALGR